jgi:MATE family multidrug resistance protein
MGDARHSTFRDLIRLAWPVLVAQLAVMANGVIDTIMAGRLSALDLAAVGIGASVYVTVFVTLMGVLLALTPTVAHFYGAGRHGEIGEEVRQSAWLGLILSALAVAVLLHPDPLLRVSHLTPEVTAKVHAYLRAMAWAVVPSLAFRVFYGFLSGIGRPRPIMVLNLLGLALKIPLNALFMYGLDMGAAGCAAATAAIAWLLAVLAWGWCARRVDCEGYGVFARLSRPSLAAMAGQLRLGLPIGATFLVDVTAFTFMALFVARLGAPVSAAHQVAANLAVLCFMLPLSIGHATSVLAGQALGAGQPRRARHTGLVGVAMGMGLSVAVAALLWFGAEIIASLYVADAGVRAIAAPLVALVALYHLADALQAVVVNALRGYKKTTVPMVVYAVSLWGVGLVGGLALGLTDWLGPARGAAGFWLASSAGLAIAGIAMTAYFLRVSQKALAPAATKA